MQYILFFALFLLTACNGGSSKPVGGPGADPADDGSSDTGRTSMGPEDVLARLGGAGTGSPDDPDAGTGDDGTSGEGGGSTDGGSPAGSGGGGTAGSDMGGSGGDTGGSGGMAGTGSGGSGSGGSGGGEPDAGPGWMPSHDQFLGDWHFNSEAVDWDECDTVDPSAFVYECATMTCQGEITVSDMDVPATGRAAWEVIGRFDHWDGDVWAGGVFGPVTEDPGVFYFTEVRFWLHDADTVYGVSRPPADIAAMYPSSRRCGVYKLTRL